MSDDEVRESIFGSKALERSAKVVDLSSMAPAARAFKPYGSPRVFHFRVLFFDPVGNYNRGVKIGKKTKSVKIKCKKKCLTPPPSIFSKKKAQKHSF